MRSECAQCGQHLEVETIHSGHEVECPGCAASVTVPAGDAAGRSAEDLRTMVQSLWAQTIKADAQPEMTLKGETMRRPGSRAGKMPDAVKVRPKDISEKGASATVPEYEILRMLGEGGMGMVYEARQTSIDRSIAVKMIKPDAAKDQEECRQFLAEAVATADLDHPNIVPIHDLGMNSEGALFYAMKEVKGTSWKDLINEKSLDENLDILMRVADAVAFAHNRGVIHRDLKPENVMLGDFGEVMLMDWGLAAAVTDEAKAERLDPDHCIGGTPTYMAPEMAVGDAARIGTGSDIYLLGAILFEIATGQKAHTGTDVMDCLANAAANQIVDTGENGELLDIARKAMATQPEDRYESVKSFQAAVREYQRHEESIALVAKAMAGIEAARQSKDYNGFARAVFQFEEAQALWPENQEAEEGAMASRLAYAECASEKRDYDLALSLLDRDEPIHRGLLTSVEKAKRERSKRRKRVRVLTAASVALTAAVLLVSVAGYFSVRAQKKKVEAALDDYRRERDARAADRRSSAPVILERARRAIVRGELDDALLDANVAVDYDPDSAESRLLRACLKIHYGQYEDAISDLDGARTSLPEGMDVVELIANCRQARVEMTPALEEAFRTLFVSAGFSILAEASVSDAEELIKLYQERIATAWPGASIRVMENGKQLELTLNQFNVGDLKPLRGIPLTKLSARSSELRDISPLEGMPLTDLDLLGSAVSDVAPLRGMALTHLNLNGTALSDLSPLKGMPLIELWIGNTAVKDLSPLSGMPLQYLQAGYLDISDISPLHGMPLKFLALGFTKVSDLTPLAGMPMETLFIAHSYVHDLAPLRGMPLRKLVVQPVAAAPEVQDIGPLAGMPLTYLTLDSPDVDDISALKGMPLTYLGLKCHSLQDLSPLKGLLLKNLSLQYVNATNLDALAGLPLEKLHLQGVPITSLKPLAGMPLRYLGIGDCDELADLTGIESLPLETLRLCNTRKISDLSPLTNLPLRSLALRNTALNEALIWRVDISPVSKLTLETLEFTPWNVTGNIDALRSMKSLKAIRVGSANREFTPSEFWRRYDAGGFRTEQGDE